MVKAEAMDLSKAEAWEPPCSSAEFGSSTQVEQPMPTQSVRCTMLRPAEAAPDALLERVRRERMAHTEDDILARSHQLKDRFPHIRTYPGLQRMLSQFQICAASSQGLQVLDIGCGKGERSLELAKLGARVQGVDISPAYVQTAREEASAAGYSDSQVHFSTMDAHRLEFPDETFDLVVGDGILHHLELDVSTAEIMRVLKVGGRALFREPLRDNPLLRLFRCLTPHRVPLTNNRCRAVISPSYPPIPAGWLTIPIAVC